jgi:uncharacterized protein (DUF1810 family)
MEKPLSGAEAERQLRQILEIAKSLRRSDAPILQNYAITILGETRAVLSHITLTDPPERVVEWE